MATTETPLVRRLTDWPYDRLERLADAHGTPLYVLDPGRVSENYRRFDRAFPEAKIRYAAKANTGRAVLDTILEDGGQIECAARGELHRAVAAGADPNNLQYTAVNPPAADLEYAVSLWTAAPGLTVTAGAMDTFDRLAERGFDGRVAIRVNPGIGTGHHEKVATGKDAKFGVPRDRLAEAVERVRARFDLVGIHAHVGSGVLHEDIDRHADALATVAELAREVDGLEFVDFGGGFGVPYREEVAPLDIEAVAQRIQTAIEPLSATPVFEPGRYIVADAAVLLTRVNTVKPTTKTTVVGVDASLATLLRPALFDAYHPIANVSAPAREQTAVSVGGPCCTSADVFTTDRPVASPRRGDILAIGNAGAYGYELASQFHSQPRPAEVTLGGRVTRAREDLADLTRLEAGP